MNSNNYNPHSKSNQYNNRQSIHQNSNHHQFSSSDPGIKFYSSAPIGKNDLVKKITNKERHEDEDSPAPDSTTEPPPRPVKQFQEGDDVFFHTDNGKHILGTVGQIQGQTCLILFGDGSQQWAPFKRVKKLSCALNEDEEESGDREKSKTEQTTAPIIPTNQQTELTCVSCGAVRRVPSKKALTYSPHTSNQFSCRRCTNKSISGSSAINFNSVSIQGPFNKSAGQKLLSRHNSGDISVQNSASARANCTTRVVSKTACAMPLPAEQGPMNVCFHCEQRTVFNDRVHCNLCERACHLGCLALSPPPLEGDRFWDVMCSACGTQKGNEQIGGRLKVFSVRRNISSWSDVVHLILCCLACKSNGQRYFDLESAIMPFFDLYLERLHLPRLYKAASPGDRKMYLLTALTNAKLRFINGKEVKKKCSLWAVRNENLRGFHVGIQPQIGTSFPVTANNTIDRSNMTANAHTVPVPGSLPAATARQIIFNKEITVIPKPPPNASFTNMTNINQGKSGDVPGKRIEKDQRNKVDSVANFITSLSETTLKISKNNGLTLTPLPDKTGLTKGSSIICDSNSKSINDRTTISSSKSVSGSSSSSSGSISDAESSSFDSETEPSSEESEASDPKTTQPNTDKKKIIPTNNGKPLCKRPVERPPEKNQRPNLRVRPSVKPNSTKKKEPAPGPSQAKKPKLSVDEPVVTSSPVVKDKQKILNSISQTTPIPIILSPLSKSSHPVTNKPSSTNVSPRVAQKTTATSPLTSDRVRRKLSSVSEDDVSDGDDVKEMNTSPPPPQTENSAAHQTQNTSKFPRAAKNLSANGNGNSNSSAPAPAAQPITQPQPSNSSSTQPSSPRVVKQASYPIPGTGTQTKATSSPVVSNTTAVQKPNGRPGRPKAARNLQLSYKDKEKPGSSLEKNKEKRKILKAVRGRGRSLVKVDKDKDYRPPGLVLANGFIDSLSTTPSSYGYNELFLSGDEPSSKNIACTNLTVRDCAFFSTGYEIKCLPPPPATNQEKIEARDRVAKYFLSELPPKAPAFWNSSSKSNQTGKSNRILPRDLNDFDSYDVVAKKVDSDGSVKYMVEWKTGFESESSSAESCDEGVNGRPVDYKNSIQNDVKIKKENEKSKTDKDLEVEKCRSSLDYFVNGLGLRRAQTGDNVPTLIDLTDSS